MCKAVFFLGLCFVASACGGSVSDDTDVDPTGPSGEQPVTASRGGAPAERSTTVAVSTPDTTVVGAGGATSGDVAIGSGLGGSTAQASTADIAATLGGTSATGGASQFGGSTATGGNGAATSEGGTYTYGGIVYSCTDIANTVASGVPMPCRFSLRDGARLPCADNPCGLAMLCLVKGSDFSAPGNCILETECVSVDSGLKRSPLSAYRVCQQTE